MNVDEGWGFMILPVEIRVLFPPPTSDRSKYVPAVSLRPPTTYAHALPLAAKGRKKTWKNVQKNSETETNEPERFCLRVM